MPFPEVDHAPPKTPSERAAALVTGDRQSSYGHPLDNHQRIARFFTARLYEKLADPVNDPITPEEAAALVRLVKEARLIQTPGHDDSLVDIAGYADVEWEIHQEQSRRFLMNEHREESDRHVGACKPPCCAVPDVDGRDL